MSESVFEFERKQQHNIFYDWPVKYNFWWFRYM